MDKIKIIKKNDKHSKLQDGRYFAESRQHEKCRCKKEHPGLFVIDSPDQEIQIPVSAINATAVL